MISVSGEYALRAAVFLSQHHPFPQTSAQIAEATKVPSGYLAKILQSMVRGEVIHSQRGLHGGFNLVRDPKDISVLDILNSVGSAPQRITECPLGLKSHVALCPVHRLLDEAIEKTEQAFATATLGALTETAGLIQPLCEQADTCATRNRKINIGAADHENPDPR